MGPDEIKEIIAAGLDASEIIVEGDGYKNEAIVVSTVFEGLNSVKRHQAVYTTLREQIASGAVHAISIKAYTPEEWENQKG